MKKIIILVIVLISLLIIGAAWFAGNSLTSPVSASVGNCPRELTCENVELSVNPA
ncbi:MAG: hypothetical protein HC846_08985, partial [Blastocatellia bacterium]|nr:hypothetical protein [Blastocatellia bacterium]